MVAIEHFSKLVVILTIHNKEAPTVAWAYLQQVLCVYGGCAELISDTGAVSS